MFTNSRTLFINLVISSNGSVRAMSNYDIECIINHLNSKRVISSQFIRFELGKESEILDSIINNGIDKIVFYIREDNYVISKLITESIKEYDDSLIIIWFGQFAFQHYTTILEDTRCDLCILYEPESTILELTTKDKKLWHKIKAIATKSGILSEYLVDDSAENVNCDAVYSPYESNSLFFNKLASVEIPLERVLYKIEQNKVIKSINSLQNVIEELEVVSQAYWGSEQVIVLRGGNIASISYFTELMDILCDRFAQCKFKITIDLGNINAEILAKLVKANCVYMDITVRHPYNMEALSLLKNYGHEANLTYGLIVYLTEENEKECIQLIKTIQEEKLVRTDNIRIISDKVVQSPSPFPRRNLLPREFLPAIGIDEQAEKYSSLIQNLNNFLTRRKEVNVSKGYASIVQLPANAMEHQMLLALKPHVGADTAIIIEGNTYFSKKNDDMFYSESTGVIRRLDRQYDIYRERLYRAGYISTNIYQVQNHDEGNISIRFNDLYLPDKRIAIIRKYGQISNFTGATNTILTVETAEDFDALGKNIEYHMATGKFRNCFELKCSIKDSCRWIGPEYCHLAKVTTLRLDREGNVMPCGGCTKSLGNIFSYQINLKDNAVTFIKHVEGERNCKECPMKDYCSRCTFLPDDIDCLRYCNLMRSSKYTPYYFKILFILKTIFNNSKHFQGVSHKDVRVSSPYASHYLPVGIAQTEGESYIHPFIHMFSVKEQPYLFNSAQNSLVKINDNAAFIIEILLKGVRVENIKAIISNHFHISMLEAEETLRSAMATLMNSGYLKRHITV